MLRRFNAVLFNVRSLSHRLAALQSSHQLIPVRCIRTRNPESGKDQQKNEKADEAQEEFGKQESEKKQDGPIPIIKSRVIVMGPTSVRRMAVMFITSFGFAAVVTYILLRQGVVPDFEAEAIPFDQFIEKFLTAGEVKEITYFPKKRLAAVHLVEGAIIDGKPFEKSIVFVKFDHPLTGQADQFQVEIRRVEENLQITRRDYIPITIGPEFSGIKMLEFVVGASILIFLLTGYFLLAARRLAQQKGKDSSRPFQKSR